MRIELINISVFGHTFTSKTEAFKSFTKSSLPKAKPQEEKNTQEVRIRNWIKAGCFQRSDFDDKKRLGNIIFLLEDLQGNGSFKIDLFKKVRQMPEIFNCFLDIHLEIEKSFEKINYRLSKQNPSLCNQFEKAAIEYKKTVLEGLLVYCTSKNKNKYQELKKILKSASEKMCNAVPLKATWFREKIMELANFIIKLLKLDAQKILKLGIFAHPISGECRKNENIIKERLSSMRV